jgi:hypothetical protein
MMEHRRKAECRFFQYEKLQIFTPMQNITIGPYSLFGLTIVDPTIIFIFTDTLIMKVIHNAVVVVAAVVAIMALLRYVGHSFPFPGCPGGGW